MQMGPDGEVSLIGDWFKLHYILNRGMAFGLSLEANNGKFILTLIRILAAGVMVYLLFRLSRQRYPNGLLWSLAAILGGALGNVVDSVFYGVYLENAPLSAPTPWFHGQAIDMFYIDLWEGFLPDWIPVWGGVEIALLPIFNLADAAIFIGIILLLVNQKRWFHKPFIIEG